MIKFSIPANFQDDLFERLDKNCVDILYGKLDSDFFGGGRPSFTLGNLSKRAFTRHLKGCHRSGLKFNYLLNATCLDNRELVRRGQKELRSLLDWLTENNVYAVTVSVPYLLEFIKRNYPRLKAHISTMAGVDSLQKARYWQDLGADRITLSVVNVNRDFRLLRLIKENISCEIQLIANLFCLYNCPFWMYHSTAHSHASQSQHGTKGFLIDYCFLRCNYTKLKDPAEFIRCGWIRPEDLHYYEEIGIDRIKIANRLMSTDAIVKLVTAYGSRHYDGNLLELFNERSKLEVSGKMDRNSVNKFRYFFRPLSVNVFKLFKLSQLLSDPGIYIDNKALSGFLEHFMKEDCNQRSCDKCNYCRDIAKKAITINEEKRSRLIQKYEDILDNIISGDIFRY